MIDKTAFIKSILRGTSHNSLFLKKEINNHPNLINFLFNVFSYSMSISSDYTFSMNKIVKYRFIDMYMSGDLYKWKERIQYLYNNRKSTVFSKDKCYAIYGRTKGEEKWQEYRKSIAMTLDNQIKKYGVEEGTKRFNSYCKKQSITNTFDYKKEKYGMTLEEFNAYNKSRAMTLDNQIKKYGVEEGTKRFNSYCKKQSVAGVKLEYFVEKYGTIEGEIIYKKVNDSKKLVLSNFIKKYGPEEGTKRFNNYKEKLERNVFSYSKQSQELFWYLFKNMTNEEDKQNTYFAELNFEKSINHNDSLYFLDFCIANKKIIIEYNGDYWHANPKKYNNTDILKFPNKQVISVEELHNRDKKRIDTLTKLGYKVYTVWEDDFINNKEKVFKECIDAINGIK